MCPRFGGVGLLGSVMLVEHEELHHAEPYPPELRRRVIDLIESGHSVAEGLEVSDQTIYNWWNQHLIDTGAKAG